MKHELVGDRWNPEDSRLYNSGYEMGYADAMAQQAQKGTRDELIRGTARKIVESVSLAYQFDNSRLYLNDLLAILNEFANRQAQRRESIIEECCAAICGLRMEKVPLDRNGRHTGSGHLGSHCYAALMRRTVLFAPTPAEP